MDNTIGGLVFFHENNSIGVLITEGDTQTRLIGTWGERGLDAEAEGYELSLKRLAPSSPRHPVAKGTLSVGETVYPIAGFLNKTAEGRVVIGLSLDEPRPGSIDCPWRAALTPPPAQPAPARRGRRPKK